MQAPENKIYSRGGDWCAFTAPKAARPDLWTKPGLSTQAGRQDDRSGDAAGTR